ncbi:MAG: hypothetical protein HXY34_03405 [Candidatus Thorarchaeota archaeon]|nr:hypothetical protein [Candidatus Thorarchaeota archaeon]
MSKENSYDGATAGRVLVFNDSGSISFPQSFRQALGTDFGLMVLSYKERTIKIFPMAAKDPKFLSIEISKLSNDFLTRLSQVFKSAGLVDLLYSTGVCLRGTRCFYECYFAPEQLVVSPKELKDSLESLEGVKAVLIETVSK